MTESLLQPLSPIENSSMDCNSLPSPCAQTLKRRRNSLHAVTSSAKRARIDHSTVNNLPSPCESTAATVVPDHSDAVESARDVIRHHFGVEILRKHNELRLINQEVAKCQVALEQLRRCHLIPYPMDCPTPTEMLDIASGKGPALQAHPDQAVPRWAAPYGVVEGPYARHYAKWLIPDSSFDGMQPEWQVAPDAVRLRGSLVEGRTTRNSCSEPQSAKPRAGRHGAGQKLQALSSGYPQPKEKAGPCVLKRADGKTVKLVCIDCHRENFSSTQGFINHCRIAHKRDFKSHEEAAVHSGHIIEVVDSGSVAGVEKVPAPATPSAPQTTPSSTSISIHPLAKSDMSEQEAYKALRSRIADSMRLYAQGKLPGVEQVPGSSATASHRGPTVQPHPSFQSATDTPYLSKLLRGRKFDGDLRDLVRDAKTKIAFEDITSGEETDDVEIAAGSPVRSSTARVPVVMRVPSKSTSSLMDSAPLARPKSSKGRPAHMSFVPSPRPANGRCSTNKDEDVEVDDANLSPHHLTNNNAPSLVSDDGEYDDSDEGSSVSGASDDNDTETPSDLAAINLEDDQESRPLTGESKGVSAPIKLQSDETKHVNFMNGVNNSAKEWRQIKPLSKPRRGTICGFSILCRDDASAHPGHWTRCDTIQKPTTW